MQIKSILQFHPSHLNQNGHQQEIKWQKMILRIWGRKNTYTLLSGFQTGSATMETSMQDPQKAIVKT